jgi:hypothetical protein
VDIVSEAERHGFGVQRGGANRLAPCQESP